MRPSDIRRFWSKVAEPDANGCRRWLGAHGTGGYALFWLNGQNWYAHRLGYSLIKGEIPEGFQVDHLCRVRDCVEADHLEPVLPRENALRSTSPAARNAFATHCVHGHAFDEENTRVTPEGWRVCRACVRRRALERHHRTKPDPERPRRSGRWKTRKDS